MDDRYEEGIFENEDVSIEYAVEFDGGNSVYATRLGVWLVLAVVLAVVLAWARSTDDSKTPKPPAPEHDLRQMST